MTLTQRLLNAGLGALLLSSAAGLPALAQESAPPERLTKAQQEKIFPARKSLLLKDLQERRTMLDKLERCSRDAKTPKALNGCQREQRKSWQALREKNREAMQKIYKDNGINAPVGGPGGKKGKGKGAGQGSEEM